MKARKKKAAQRERAAKTSPFTLLEPLKYQCNKI